MEKYAQEGGLMLRVEEWMNIRQMVQEGVPVVQMARLLGRDRKTVAKAAGSEHVPCYQRGPRSSKLLWPETISSARALPAPVHHRIPDLP